MQPGRCRLPLQQNNQAALRDELRPERELWTLRLPLLARALVVRAREVVLRLLRPELVERERADVRLPERDELDRADVRPADREDRAEVRPPGRDERERADVERPPLERFERAEVERVPAERGDLVREFPPVELFARELRDEADRPRLWVERLRDLLRLRPPPFSAACAVWRLTSLLNRLSPFS
jgi:hypothetical protein